MQLLKNSLDNKMIRNIPLAGSLSATIVATGLFVAGTIPLATVGLIIAFTSLFVACYISLFVETAEHTRIGVAIFLIYASGMGALTAPGVFGYEYFRPPSRILAGLLLGFLITAMWIFYVQVDENHRHRGF